MPGSAQASQRRRGPGRPAGAHGSEGRDRLLRAARELMSEKGLPRVTAREVAARAGVRPALVNYYFGGKQGLLQAVVSEVASELRGRIQRAVTQRGSFEQRMGRLIRGWVAAMSADPYAPRLVVEQVLFADTRAIDAFVERFGRDNAAALVSLLEEGQASGDVRPVEPMLLIPALVGICVFYFLSAPLQQRLFGLAEITPELTRRFADGAVELVMRGLAAPPEGAQ